MKRITSAIFAPLLISLMAVTLGVVPTVSGQEDVQYEVLDDIGTHFELQHFNVSITTDATVHIILRVSSEMIDYLIETASEAISTQLILENLEPLTTYYMYEDSYMKETVFTTDVNGSYAHIQDLIQFHHIFIQSNSSTIFISEDTTLQSNIYDAVEIVADDVVLDLNGYSIIGPAGVGFGVVSRCSGITIKNGGIRNFGLAGIVLYHSENCTISGNRIDSNGWFGVELEGSNYNIIDGNTITRHRRAGIDIIFYAVSNTITGNTISNNDIGMQMWPLCRFNVIYHNNFIDNRRTPQAECKLPGAVNTFDNDYPSGGNYWSDYTGIDEYSGPYQNEPGSDGIGDTPYEIGYINEDRYPLVQPYAQTAIQDMILVIKSWHLEHNGFEQSLIAKLESAIGLLENGNINGAIRKLQDLVKQVTNDATHLTQEQKDYIIETTQEIIANIG